ncbi:MAG: hypothetical protein NVSMB25_26130 [Thermoleophilaceae bacterium]
MSTLAILIVGGAIALSGYAVLILAPAWRSYGRIWERLAAGALTLYLLLTLMVIGVVLGLVIFLGAHSVI